MLEARRRGLFRRTYDVTADGEPVTELVVGRRESCEFALGGVPHQIERDGRRRFVLRGPGGQLAVAEQESGRRWRLSAPSGNVQLARPSIWRPRWEVEQRGSVRGEIRPRSGIRRTVTADLPADLAPPVGILALYLVLTILARQAAAHAAANSG